MNTKSTKDQIIPNLLLSDEDYIEVYIQQFIAAKRSENLSKHSIKYYQLQLAKFNRYCEAHSVKTMQQLTTQFLREYLVYLGEQGHNVGGVNTVHRAVRAFCKWFWFEMEPDYPNPVIKVRPPKIELEPLDAVTAEQFETLLALCQRDTFVGERDRSILMLLVDTGLRASELCDIRIEDIDVMRNSIFIPKGKGRKPRTVFFGHATRKQIRRFIKLRLSDEFLFTSRSGEKMSYNTLRQLLRRLCDEAGIQGVSLHSFRRAFALNALQNGTDPLSISKLLGHSDMALLNRYIKQNTRELEAKFKSALDNWFEK